MKNVMVIGAGFSGAVVAARLLQQASVPLRVILVNGDGRIGRGMAYGTQSASHVLNVPSGNMSAFPELPNHFLNYAQSIDPTIAAGSFVSRRIYGDYLERLLNEAECAAPTNVELSRVYRQVKSITHGAEKHAILVTLESNETIEVERVVLALGHFPASPLPEVANLFFGSDRYLHDPWDHSRLDAIPARAPVILLGTGLTAVDVAMTLLSRNPERKITAVSRRGLLPQAHRHTAGKPFQKGTASVWGDANTVRSQLKGLRQHCRDLADEGRDWREVFALLRPVTSNIWLAYTDKERRRFLRHVQPYWDTHRHRLAPEVAGRFNAALGAGVVNTLAGRVLDFESDGHDVQIKVRPRGKPQPQVLRAQHVINCTGPCADPRKAESALVKQLLNDGLMRTDELGLGIDVASDCSVISTDGHASQNLFYIGPWLKAKYWEATAVPDLRVIAAELASRILQETD